VAAATRGGCKTLRKAGERLGSDALDGDKPIFFQARDLARERIKFAVAGKNARHRARGQRREQAADEVVGVGRHRDGGGIGQGQHRGDASLYARQEYPEYRLPFPVGEARGIFQRAAVAPARRVRPEMMAVRGEMNARGIGATEFAEMLAQIERHALGSAVYL
jgi:hypothetical protein